jgi:hypothetical protein
MNVYSAGNYQLRWTRNPLEEWDSAGNYQLINEESTEVGILQGFYSDSDL